MKFAGGQVFDEPSGKIASANITPDATGIGGYTEETFLKAMRTGYVGKRQLNTLMPWQFYAGQTDEDLKNLRVPENIAGHQPSRGQQQTGNVVQEMRYGAWRRRR